MSARPLTVACLCAAWCRTCDAYRGVFETAVDELRAAGHAVDAHWIDIEEEADRVGDLDVATFPTLLVAAGQQICFYGPLEPQPETLRRVLRSALEATGATGTAEVLPAVLCLLRGLAG